VISGQFAFDGTSRRMAIVRRDDENDDHEFHCGNCFEIEIEGKWYAVRIEHSSVGGWYLIGLPKHFQSRALLYQGNFVRIL
jgi:hypothetical protein